MIRIPDVFPSLAHNGSIGDGLDQEDGLVNRGAGLQAQAGFLSDTLLE